MDFMMSRSRSKARSLASAVPPVNYSTHIITDHQPISGGPRLTFCCVGDRSRSNVS